MNKKVYLIFLGVFLASAIGLRLWRSFYIPGAEIYLNGSKLKVLVADNEERKYNGLGGRDDLGAYDGMIFIYTEAGRLGVVMRAMRFPLDIIWLKNGEVVDIAPNILIEPGAPEESLRVYYPRVEANVFLELRAGWTVSHNLKIGDKLEVVE